MLADDLYQTDGRFGLIFCNRFFCIHWYSVFAPTMKNGHHLGFCYVQDVSVFTEIDMEKMKYPMGLNLTIVTSAQTDAEAKELLTLMEVPFAR